MFVGAEIALFRNGKSDRVFITMRHSNAHDQRLGNRQRA